MKRIRYKSNGNDDGAKHLLMSSCRRVGLTPPKSKIRSPFSQTPSPLSALSTNIKTASPSLPSINSTPTSPKNIKQKALVAPDPPKSNIKASGVEVPTPNTKVKDSNIAKSSPISKPSPNTNLKTKIEKSITPGSPPLKNSSAPSQLKTKLDDLITLTPISSSKIKTSTCTLPLQTYKIVKSSTSNSESIPKIRIKLSSVKSEPSLLTDYSIKPDPVLKEHVNERLPSPISLTPPTSTMSDMNIIETPTSSITESRLPLKRSLSSYKKNILKNVPLKKTSVSSPRKKKSRISIDSQKKSSQSSLSQSNMDYDSDEDFAMKPLKRKSSKMKSKDEQKRESKALENEIEETRKRLKAKLEELDNLKRNSEDAKNRELAILIETWRTACQEALNELLNSNMTRRGDKEVNMDELLNLLHIPHGLVRYNEDDMCFY